MKWSRCELQEAKRQEDTAVRQIIVIQQEERIWIAIIPWLKFAKEWRRILRGSWIRGEHMTPLLTAQGRICSRGNLRVERGRDPRRTHPQGSITKGTQCAEGPLLGHQSRQPSTAHQRQDQGLCSGCRKVQRVEDPQAQTLHSVLNTGLLSLQSWAGRMR